MMRHPPGFTWSRKMREMPAFNGSGWKGMGPAHQDHGIEDAVQPIPGKRVHSKAGVAPEVGQTDDLGSFQDGRIIVETEAIIESQD